jgi:hypothetical protein
VVKEGLSSESFSEYGVGGEEELDGDAAEGWEEEERKEDKAPPLFDQPFSPAAQRAIRRPSRNDTADTHPSGGGGGVAVTAKPRRASGRGGGSEGRGGGVAEGRAGGISLGLRRPSNPGNKTSNEVDANSHSPQTPPPTRRRSSDGGTTGGPSSSSSSLQGKRRAPRSARSLSQDHPTQDV